MSDWGPKHCNQCRYSENLCGKCYRAMLDQHFPRRCEGGDVHPLANECLRCGAPEGGLCQDKDRKIA